MEGEERARLLVVERQKIEERERAAKRDHERAAAAAAREVAEDKRGQSVGRTTSSGYGRARRGGLVGTSSNSTSK